MIKNNNIRNKTNVITVDFIFLFIFPTFAIWSCVDISMSGKWLDWEK